MTKSKRNALIGAIVSTLLTVGYQFLPPQYQVALATLRAVVSSVTSDTPPAAQEYTIPSPDPLN